MKRWRHLSATDVLRLVPILLIFHALVVVFAFPMKAETHTELLLAASVGALYLALIMTPFLPGRKSIADTTPPWIPFGNTFVVTFAVMLLGDQVPMISAFYLVSIAAVAARRGLGSGLWTAFLSTLGYLLALAFTGRIYAHIPDSMALIGVFFLIAVLTGALAQTAQRHAHTLEKALTALEIERAAEARQHRALEAERALATTVSQTLDLQQVLNLALDQALAALQADAGAIYLADDAQTELTLAVSRNLPEVFAARAQHYRFGEGITGHAAAQREAIHVSNVEQDARIVPAVHQVSPMHSQISVPLLVQDRVVGVLNVNGFGTRDFAEEDLTLLRAIAASVAVAIDRARLIGTLEQRVAERTAELAALHQSTQALLEIALAASSNLDLRQTLRQIALQTARACRMNRCTIFLLDQTGQYVEPIMSQFADGHADREQWQSFRQMARESVEAIPLFRQVIQEQKPVILESAAQIDLLPSRWTEPFGIERLFAVPLVSRGRAIGVMVLDGAAGGGGVTPRKSSRGGHQPAVGSDDGRDDLRPPLQPTFTAEQISLATTIGAQVTAAIENARLFEETRRRANQVAALYDTTRDLAAQHDLSALLQTIVERAAALLHTPGGSIYLYDPVRDDLELAVSKGLSLPLGTRLQMGEGMAGRVAQTRQPLIVDDYRTWEHRSPKFEGVPLTALAQVPILYGGELLGVLSVRESTATTRKFTQEDVRLLSLFAAQAASAVRTARLFEAERRARTRAEALREAAQVISRSLELEEVLRLLLEQLKRVLIYDSASVLLLGREGQPNLVAGIGYADEKMTSRAAGDLLKTSPILAQMARDLKPVTIGDVREHPGWIWIPGAEHVRSFLAVPIVARQRMIGALMVDNTRLNFFGEDDVRTAQALAQHIGIAIENARLFESVERQLVRIGTLREIDRSLSSMLELAPMLETMLSRLAQVVPYDSAAVLFLEGNTLRALAARGRSEERLREFALDVSNNAIFQQMAKTHLPVVIGDLRERSDWVVVPGVEFARAWIGVPLMARGALIGQIGLFSATPHAFTREHSDLLLAFANHAAIAIANVRLHAELKEQARRDSLTQVLNHGTFVAELRAAGKKAQERGQPLALIMLDLDNFKRYNDTYGHIVGDAVLTATVQAIRAHVKQKDFVGRWGGEEFGVALRGADTAHALQVAERIRATLAATPILDRQGNPIPPPTASQGIAVLPESARDVDALIENADRALYRAKARGRDQVACAE